MAAIWRDFQLPHGLWFLHSLAHPPWRESGFQDFLFGRHNRTSFLAAELLGSEVWGPAFGGANIPGGSNAGLSRSSPPLLSAY